MLRHACFRSSTSCGAECAARPELTDCSDSERRGLQYTFFDKYVFFLSVPGRIRRREAVDLGKRIGYQ